MYFQKPGKNLQKTFGQLSLRFFEKTQTSLIFYEKLKLVIIFSLNSGDFFLDLE